MRNPTLFVAGALVQTVVRNSFCIVSQYPTFFNSHRLSVVQVDSSLSSATSRRQLELLATALRDDGVTGWHRQTVVGSVSDEPVD